MHIIFGLAYVDEVVKYRLYQNTLSGRRISDKYFLTLYKEERFI